MIRLLVEIAITIALYERIQLEAQWMRYGIIGILIQFLWLIVAFLDKQHLDSSYIVRAFASRLGCIITFIWVVGKFPEAQKIGADLFGQYDLWLNHLLIIVPTWIALRLTTLDKLHSSNGKNT